MANSRKIMGEAVDTVVGLAAGAADQGVQIWDDNRASAYATANPGKNLSMWKQGGTYLDFVAPVLGLITLGVMSDRVSDKNIARVATVSGQLAGRKLVHRFATVNGAHISPAPYAEYRRAALERAAREAAQRAEVSVYTSPGLPQPILTGTSTPVVTPQNLAGGGGLG